MRSQGKTVQYSQALKFTSLQAMWNKGETREINEKQVEQKANIIIYENARKCLLGLLFLCKKEVKRPNA
jgi:hypothetical protein